MGRWKYFGRGRKVSFDHASRAVKSNEEPLKVKTWPAWCRRVLCRTKGSEPKTIRISIRPFHELPNSTVEATNEVNMLTTY